MIRDNVWIRSQHEKSRNSLISHSRATSPPVAQRPRMRACLCCTPAPTAARTDCDKKRNETLIAEKLSVQELKGLSVEVLAQLTRLVASPSYRFWRFVNHLGVANPDHRHYISLPLTTSLVSVLGITIGHTRHILQHVLESDSPLVEVASIVSLPGSSDQEVNFAQGLNPLKISCLCFPSITLNIQIGPFRCSIQHGQSLDHGLCRS